MAQFTWQGDGAPRMETVIVEWSGGSVRGVGMQVGAGYGLRYRLGPTALELELVDGRSATVELGDADFFDLAWSPLFNSLPVLRDGLIAAGPPRTYRMRWVDVPSLAVHESEQEYTPYGSGRLGFRTGNFEAEIRLDADGFVTQYPGVATRTPD